MKEKLVTNELELNLQIDLLLRRIYLDEKYTIGKLFVNGVYLCDTLEDAVIDINKNGKIELPEVKIKGASAIPYGFYPITLYNSPRFGMLLPLLNNVNSFSYILIHSGNTIDDTDGCILVGENTQKGKVLNSKKVLKKLMDILVKAKQITITIV